MLQPEWELWRLLGLGFRGFTGFKVFRRARASKKQHCFSPIASVFFYDKEYSYCCFCFFWPDIRSSYLVMWFLLGGGVWQRNSCTFLA